MNKNSGIIYDLGNERFGIAYNSEQLPAFKNYNKVYLHVFLDRGCNIPERDPVTQKKYVTLKHITTIKAIGFTD